MYLIITAIAAIVVTIIWRSKAPNDKYKLSTLSLIFWGATIMWIVDHVMAFLMEGGEFLEISLDATMLGVCVVVLGVLAWLVMLLIQDPKKVFNVVLKR